MSDIQKECWIKNTVIKLFGKIILEKSEQFDGSIFDRPENAAFYSIPDCFKYKD